MAKRVVRGLTGKQKLEIWRRWKEGESLSDIGRVVGKHASAVFVELKVKGGIYAPPRHRSKVSLTMGEREEISRGLAGGDSMRGIARQLGRRSSTISREVARNGGVSVYRAAEADSQAWERARRPKSCKLVDNVRLRRIVERKLRLDWSPEQISNWLKRSFPDDESLQVSHETLYRSLFVQARGALKKELLQHLRSHRVMRRSAKTSTTGRHNGQVIDGISIRQRPASVEDRAVPGHWEGDLISGSHNTHIATLVERRSRYVILSKVKGKDTNSVVSALKKRIKRLPAELRKSLTWDRGSEMVSHESFTLATDVAVYFCDPHSPWQRGSNENTNGLLRQYFPKGTDLSVHSQSDLNKVAWRLNTRPRKTLGFMTPAEKFNQTVASTH
jgi:transposase, IS30 family